MNYVYTVMAHFWKEYETISLGLVNDCNSNNSHEEWTTGIGRSDLGSLLLEILNADLSSIDSHTASDQITALYTDYELQNGFLETEASSAIDVLSRIRKFIDFFDNKGIPYNLSFFNFLWNNSFFLEDVSILKESQKEFDRILLWDKENDCLIGDIDMIYQTVVEDARMDGSEVFLFAGEYRIWATALVSIREVVKAGKLIKKCKNCGRYFFPSNRSDEIYCSNNSHQDPSMTCKEYGNKRLWYEKQKEDQLATLSRKIASAKGMLAKRNPDIPEYTNSYNYFKAQRLIWIKEVKEGIKSAEEYRKWLLYMQSQKIIKEASHGID